jgi:hypothetical protein
MKLNLKKSIILIVVLAIIAAEFFWIARKLDFFGEPGSNIAADPVPNQFGSRADNPAPPGIPPYIPSPSNPAASSPSSVPAAPANSSSSAPSAGLPKSILLSVPFFAQAPFGEWSNPIFQNACEEASVAMAMHWVNKTSVTLEQAKSEIVALSEFEDRAYGTSSDRSAADTTKIFKDYYGYSGVKEKEGILTKDIKAQVLAGNLVIVPVNGQILKNPFYTAPGPDHHMLVIIGYDGDTGEFITNDVGTRHGQNFRYSEARLAASLQNYPTGNDLPSIPGQTAMIVVRPK